LHYAGLFAACGKSFLIQSFFDFFGFQIFMFDADAQTAVNAHPLIGEPRQQEKRQNVAAPIVEKNFEVRQNQNQKRYPMAETILASENVKKFTLKQIFAGFASFLAKIARFTKNFFLRNRPRNRSDDQRKYYKRINLR
jgi:hypothetical protein